MKKTSFFIFLLSCFCQFLKAQTTYYWVGGNGNNGVTSFTSNSNWNTSLDGSGTVRAAEDSTDKLIIDGSNIGGITPITGSIITKVGSTIMGQLTLRNNVNVSLLRVVTGTGSVKIKGDLTADDDLKIDAGSVLSITVADSVAATSGNNLQFLPDATARIYGTLNVLRGASQLVCKNPLSAGAVVFESGSTCNVNTTNASYNPFGTGNSTSSKYSYPNSFIFKSGSTFVFLGGTCPFTTSSSFPFLALVLKTGSTTKISSAIPGVTTGLEFTSSNFFNGRLFSNVIITSGTTVIADFFKNIDNLIIENGASFYLKSSGASPISGNIVNNGTLGSVAGFTSSNLLFKGITPQTIGGTGTFAPFGAVSVATDADVTLNTNVIVNGSTNSLINGKLNLQNYTYSGTGTVQTKAQLPITSNATGNVGSDTIKMDPTVYASGINTAGVYNGILVSGNGVPANSYIIGTSSGSSYIIISNKLTGPLTSVTLSGNYPVIRTSNANGLDGSFGSVGAISFTSSTDYIYDGPTITPFSSRASATMRNLTINTNVTTNSPSIRMESLTVNNGRNFIIRSTDTVNVQNNVITGRNAIDENAIRNYIHTNSTKKELKNNQEIIATDKIKNL
jgi:hypothetical protein